MEHTNPAASGDDIQTNEQEQNKKSPEPEEIRKEQPGRQWIVHEKGQQITGDSAYYDESNLSA